MSLVQSVGKSAGREGARLKQCVFCGGPVRHKRSTKYAQTLEEERRVVRVVIEAVPADVCERCGEKEYAAEVAEHILAILQKAKTEAKEELVASRFYSYKTGRPED